ncbi:ribokinase [Asticcacaulis sp. AC402]|uniref:ribokinase n=1 Tax=Asticcacaulis sp. AC402 TaxID=1282361 RepID=UPI0003C3EA39|nr:ribokinase [Asticcacaulis sp. AC402]ESQ77709.1 carbohydrate kinase [Asticcacaulis sp. AC402]
MSHIVVAGSINVDVFLDVTALPKANETIIGKAMRQAIGGKGLNQAVACAKLGPPAHMVAAVGDDALAPQATAFLAQNGVLTDYVKGMPGATTGLANILVAEDGQNMIVVTPGANGLLSPGDIDAASSLIASASALVVQLEVPLATVRRALDVARQHGVLTVLNPAPVDPAAMELMRLADLVTPNETELMRLTGISDVSDASLITGLNALIAAGAKQALVTLGSEGCAALMDGALVRLPAYKVKAVDATGAGDIFNGALVTRLVAGDGLLEAMRYGCAASALSVTKPSANACPTPAEVAELMAQQPQIAL